MEDLNVITNVSNPFNDAPVSYIEETSSTMRLAEEYSLSHTPVSGTVIMAGKQTSGRGRIPGRKWEAVKDKNLLFTLVLTKEEMGINPLPVVIGLGISKYLEKYHQLIPQIKWPNDIYINSRKISGIIIESRKGLFNIGIGININQQKFTNSIALSATSLSIEKNRDFNLLTELELILNELKDVLAINSWQKEIFTRLHNKGKVISVNTGIPGKDKIITGVIEGIGSSGQLLLRSEKKLTEIFSGEIQQ